MANMNDITEQSTVAPMARNTGKLDLATARHTQALAILSALTADLTDEEPVLSTSVIAGSLWAVQALIEQAQEAVRQM